MNDRGMSYKRITKLLNERNITNHKGKKWGASENSVYSVQRLCFSLKTNSDSTAIRYSKSITQRLDDYWFGILLQNI